jgi:diguanylate cyclase (GGDEF)-like protein
MYTDEKQDSILAVDDDPHILKLVEYNLQKANFQVWTAENGLSALEVLRGKPVDLILCDVMMPDLDGFMLRDWVRNDVLTRNIPFIFLTAKAQPSDQVKGLSMGAEDYVTKPFDPLVLIARVKAALDRRRTYAEMERWDALTQVLNRHTLELEIKKELERVIRHDGVGSLIFADLDDFKQVNDQHGHAVGDKTLIRFASLLRQTSRKIDVIGRYGGEEFVLYLPETREGRAVHFANRMLESFQTPSEEPDDVRTSFSAGVAEAPRDASDVYTLCDRADRAMYEAKQRGKAQVVVWRETKKARNMAAKDADTKSD